MFREGCKTVAYQQRKRSAASELLADAIIQTEAELTRLGVSNTTRLYIMSRLKWAYREGELADLADALAEQIQRTKAGANRHWWRRYYELGELARDTNDELAA